MRKLKIHLIKYFTPKTRLIILGPLIISPQRLRKNVKFFDPTLIILLDGGTCHLKHLLKKDQDISISIGDGDSTSEAYLPLDFTLPLKKNYSDLEFVVEALLKTKNSIDSLSLMGLFSSEQREERLDHLLFNIGTIQNISKKLSLKILMDERFLFLPAGKNNFEYQGLFSLISLTSNKLKISGKVDYCLKDWTKLKALSSLGLSNIARGKVIIKSINPIVIYFAGTKFNL